MPKNCKKDIINFLLEVHRKGVEMAKELSIRTGVPMVFEENGKIFEVKPKYKYVRVPIDEDSHPITKTKRSP